MQNTVLSILCPPSSPHRFICSFTHVTKRLEYLPWLKMHVWRSFLPLLWLTSLVALGKLVFLYLPPPSLNWVFFFFFGTFLTRLLWGLSKLTAIRDWDDAWHKSACWVSVIITRITIARWYALGINTLLEGFKKWENEFESYLILLPEFTNLEKVYILNTNSLIGFRVISRQHLKLFNLKLEVTLKVDCLHLLRFFFVFFFFFFFLFFKN